VNYGVGTNVEDVAMDHFVYDTGGVRRVLHKIRVPGIQTENRTRRVLKTKLRN
jgi:hypothetical protein